MNLNRDNHEKDELEFYGDTGIASYEGKVPKFLIFTYILLPIWGFASLYYFWNGSIGWFDRGTWHELQVAANTTFPIENQNLVKQFPLQNDDDDETGKDLH